MKTSDIEVGQTYLYRQGNYGVTQIARVTEVSSKAERGTTSTIQVIFLAIVHTHEVIVIPNKDLRTLWVQPRHLLSPTSVEEAKAYAKDRLDRHTEKVDGVHKTVAVMQAALKDTGLPLPVPDRWSNDTKIQFPRWSKRDYDRLIDLLANLGYGPAVNAGERTADP